jgi:hypothetical protein
LYTGGDHSNISDDSVTPSMYGFSGTDGSGSNGCTGGDDGTDALLQYRWLQHFTWNVYATPLTSGANVTVVCGAGTFTPSGGPGDAGLLKTVHDSMWASSPPASTGYCHDTFAAALPGCATTLVGGDGVLTTAADAVADGVDDGDAEDAAVVDVLAEGDGSADTDGDGANGEDEDVIVAVADAVSDAVADADTVDVEDSLSKAHTTTAARE